MSREQVLELLMFLGGSYQTYRPDDETINSFCVLLSDVEASEAIAAVLELIPENTTKYAPDPGEIVRRVQEIRMRKAGFRLPEETWGKFDCAISREALRLCGGARWYMSLPDPSYSGRGYDVVTLSKARAHYAEMYRLVIDRALKGVGTREVLAAIEQTRPAALPGTAASKRITDREE